jgi:shikimate kinase
MKRPLYLITGPSGSGKTAVSDYLNSQGATAIDVDSTPGLCYFVNKNGKPVPYPSGADAAWWNTHNYVWELDRIRKLLGTLDNEVGPIFLCGNAGNIAKAWDMFDQVFYLDTPPEMLLKRINQLGRDNSFGQRVDEHDQLMRWIEPFKTEMLGLGAISIDATQSVEGIAKDILKRIKTTP